MAQDEVKKEALFNEVKGSLFEFLVGKELAIKNGEELSYLQSIDKNYLHVLSQQDRMVRQFYPEMGEFLGMNSKLMARKLFQYFDQDVKNPKLMGKFINSPSASEWHEADLVVEVKKTSVPISLKINKKNAFVNTKSGGIKSFFTQYFSAIDSEVQKKYNQLVDLEFSRMAYELHEMNGLEYSGNFTSWVNKGFSELPGELEPDGRAILKSYYARLALEMHRILLAEFQKNPHQFKKSLSSLMGFSSEHICQAVCFHEFKTGNDSEIAIHSYQELQKELSQVEIMPFEEVSSVLIHVGSWSLQIRIKPMNKFTTTAIKINCAVRFKRPNDV